MDLLTSTNSELQFSSVGCQYVDKGNVCGEKDSLAIIVEMQKMYEEKMSILDREGGGDYEALQAKNRLQEMWIKDLIQQSKMLISAIQELEREATERVRLLEQRIKKNSHTGTEVMSKYRDLDIRYNISETYQSVIYLQSDIHNLVKIIKQFQNDGVWSSEGFHFYFVNSDDLKFDAQRYIASNGGKSTEPIMENYAEKLEELKKDIQEKDLRIKKLDSVVKDLRTKTGSKNTNGVEELKRAMEDMRSALTAEVADKHEIILSLRRDIHQLEEQCKQADKQMIFKDDIIKEMRKDIKHLKSEMTTMNKNYEKEQKKQSIKSSSEKHLKIVKPPMLPLSLSHDYRKTNRDNLNCITFYKNPNFHRDTRKTGGDFEQSVTSDRADIPRQVHKRPNQALIFIKEDHDDANNVKIVNNETKSPREYARVSNVIKSHYQNFSESPRNADTGEEIFNLKIHLNSRENNNDSKNPTRFFGENRYQEETNVDFSNGDFFRSSPNSSEVSFKPHKDEVNVSGEGSENFAPKYSLLLTATMVDKEPGELNQLDKVILRNPNNNPQNVDVNNESHFSKSWPIINCYCDQKKNGSDVNKYKSKLTKVHTRQCCLKRYSQ